MKLPAFLATALFAGTTLHSHAALVTWGGATTIGGESDVSLNGTLVAAFNVGGPGEGPATVNTVNFAAFAVASPSVTVGNFNINGFTFAGPLGDSGANPYAALTLAYRGMLDGLAGTDFSLTLTMSALTIGATYEFQWWSNRSDLRFDEQTTAAAGNSVALLSNTTNSEGGLGQFAIGTFVADSATQGITFSNTGEGAAYLNGFQLRQLAPASVPEPGTALAGLLVMGLCGMRRRR